MSLGRVRSPGAHRRAPGPATSARALWRRARRRTCAASMLERGVRSRARLLRRCIRRRWARCEPAAARRSRFRRRRRSALPRHGRSDRQERSGAAITCSATSRPTISARRKPASRSARSGMPTRWPRPDGSTSARALFEQLLARRNPLGLLSEDIHPATGELWGNFPQTYSLVGLINTAMRLSRSWESMLLGRDEPSHRHLQSCRAARRTRAPAVSLRRCAARSRSTAGSGSAGAGERGDRRGNRPRSCTRERDGNIEYALLDLTRTEYERLLPRLRQPHVVAAAAFPPVAARIQARRLRRLSARQPALRRALARLLRDDDLVWIHDYHLIPLAAELRALGVRPAHRLLPAHSAAAAGAADDAAAPRASFSRRSPPTISSACRTARDRDALLEYFRTEMGARTSPTATCSSRDGRRPRVRAFPIAIDTAAVARQAAHAVDSAATQRLVRSLEHRALAIGVDRLDYSKGLPQRFEAFAHFLSRASANGARRFRSCRSRRRRARRCRNIASCARGSKRLAGRDQRTLRRTRLDADPLRQPQLQPVDAGGLLPRGRCRGGDAAARRHESRRQGIRRRAGAGRSRRADPVELRRRGRRAHAGDHHQSVRCRTTSRTASKPR